jgi:hypothetical protein
MNTALMVADVLVILAFFGVILALVALVVVALKMKRDVTRNAKRIYERPMQSAKNLATTGKGIVMQEKVRVESAVATVKATAEIVKATAADTAEAASALRDVDWAPILEAAQTGMKFAQAMAGVAKSSKGQGRV